MRPKHLALAGARSQLRDSFLALKGRRDVAALLEVTDKELVYLLFRNGGPRYREFTITKRDGSARVISAPDGSLKIVQKKLNQILRAVYVPRAPVHGFAQGKSIVSNAASHSGRRWIFNIDLENFFPTIHFGRVRGMFAGKLHKLPEPAARALAQICCYKGALPQGAPTSPVVSNMVCAGLDIELRRLASLHKCHYTRYADDITFSSDQPIFPNAIAVLSNDGVSVGDDLRRIIESASFKINEAKVRIRSRGQRQEVTGLVANEVPNVPREYVRRVRGMLHAWAKFGEDDAEREMHSKYYRKQRRDGAPQPRFKDVLRGRLNFIRMVKGQDNPVFVGLWNRSSDLDPAQFRRLVPVRSFDRVGEGLWIIESDSEALQGTAFMMEDGRLLTCAHCAFPDCVVYRTDDVATKFKVTVVAKDENRDVAIVSIVGSPAKRGTIALGDSKGVETGDSLTVFGFPHYAPGGKEHRITTPVTSTTQLFTYKHFVLADPVYAGNSGGPVFDKNCRLVGIVRTGWAGAGPQPARCLAIEEVQGYLRELDIAQSTSTPIPTEAV